MRKAFKIPAGYLMVHEETLRQLLPEAAMAMLMADTAPKAAEEPGKQAIHKERPRQLRNVGDVPLVDRRVSVKSDECRRRVEAVRAIGLPTNYDPNVGMVTIRTPEIRVNYFATTSNWFDVKGRLDMGVGHGLENFLAKLAEKVMGGGGMKALYLRWMFTPAAWWQFWMPQSGPAGGFLGGILIAAAAYAYWGWA